VIGSFRDKETRGFFETGESRRFTNIRNAAYRKLHLLNDATVLADLRSPGNSLEALKGDRAGKWAIRVSGQYRICFEWRDGDAYEVEIVDYH
jgi:proteic killer suppression protein